MDPKKDKKEKEKEKKAKPTDKAEKDKKDKKPKASTKDREKVSKLMQKEYDAWLEEADETANIGTSIETAFCRRSLSGVAARERPSFSASTTRLTLTNGAIPFLLPL